MKLPFYTVGHSNRSLAEFTALLVEFDIGVVADIRRFPMSKTNPQFNEDILPGALRLHDISYEHIAALGGRREKTRGVICRCTPLTASGAPHRNRASEGLDRRRRISSWISLKFSLIFWRPLAKFPDLNRIAQDL